MSWRAGVGWGLGLWLVAGGEAAVGGGFPGPLLLLALAAGLSGGPTLGAVVGACAGFLGGVLAGGGHFALAATGAAAGALAGAAAPWISRRNPIWALLAAALVSFLISLLLCLLWHRGGGEAVRFAALRAGQNMLWMLPIYGAVLLLAPRAPRVDVPMTDDIPLA
jgi:hypothetical protein